LVTKHNLKDCGERDIFFNFKRLVTLKRLYIKKKLYIFLVTTLNQVNTITRLQVFEVSLKMFSLSPLLR